MIDIQILAVYALNMHDLLVLIGIPTLFFYQVCDKLYIYMKNIYCYLIMYELLTLGYSSRILRRRFELGHALSNIQHLQNPYLL